MLFEIRNIQKPDTVWILNDSGCWLSGIRTPSVYFKKKDIHYLILPWFYSSHRYLIMHCKSEYTFIYRVFGNIQKYTSILFLLENLALFYCFDFGHHMNLLLEYFAEIDFVTFMLNRLAKYLKNITKGFGVYSKACPEISGSQFCCRRSDESSTSGWFTSGFSKRPEPSGSDPCPWQIQFIIREFFWLLKKSIFWGYF